MTCRPMRRYQGTKSQKIIGMINDKLKEEKQKQIKTIVKNKELLKAKKECDEVYLNYKKEKVRLEKIERKLGIEWYSYDKKFNVCSNCLVPTKEMIKLQTANDLATLGNTKGAKVIWNKLMEKYKIGE